MKDPMNTDQTLHPRPTIESLREKLAGRTGEHYWRSLDEIAQTEEFRAALAREFPSEVSVWDDGVSRRKFLQLMGASIALAGLSSCVKQPDEKIVPYVKQPEYLIPGKPLTFASAFTAGGFATGILVTSHMGRPTKVQGNPDHPASRGATDIFSQASILHLYDPDRSQAVRKNGDISTPDKFLIELFGALDAQKTLGGRGIRVLTGTITSPTFASQMKSLLALYPQAKWARYEPAGIQNEREGTKLAFGGEYQVVYDFRKADVVLSLDSDFMSDGPAHLVHARDYAARRKVTGTTADMNRLYVAESFPTVTGSVADHRLPVRAGRIGSFAAAIAAELGVTGAGAASLSPEESAWVKAVAADLREHRGSSIVVAGSQHAGELHALVHAINATLGNNGSTVSFLPPAEVTIPGSEETLAELVGEMNSGDVDMLLIAGSNPCFDAPAGLGFTGALGKVRMSVNLSLYNDETARRCRWHVPESHYLEAWSDARAFDGTATIIQPLIAPLYNTMSLHELFAELTGKSGSKAYDIIRDQWKNAARSVNFEDFWKTSLNDGMIAGTASAPARPALNTGRIAAFAAAVSATGGENAPPGGIRRGMESLRASGPGSAVEVNFRPDPTIGDGRYANNGWLQELPKPVTKLTWDNAAFVSPALASSLGVSDEEMVEVEVNGMKRTAPVLILPGHPTDSVTLHFGYGRTNAGKVGNGTGFDVYALRTPASPLFAAAAVRKTSGRRKLARTQDHHSMEGRAIFRTATVGEFEKNPRFAREMSHVPAKDESLYPEHEYDGYKWAMSIDLNACTGCNACVIGCQSENNIPVVGKDQVLNGREMHWIRIDRYYEGDLDNPAIYSQPVACMHCENAPCEPVCPVAATSHDHEGLNVMVYNRCVGTRYCSNNCPYKVRRFNFLQFSDKDTESLQLLYNPDVTVRNRGVMEKCTYCVQRISAARIDAKKENRDIREGEVMTACQSACPAQAITFGNLNDPGSAVSKAKAEPRDYGLLTELNTVPRTSYLARVRNPNPALENRG